MAISSMQARVASPAVPRSSGPHWERVCLAACAEVPAALEAVIGSMATAGYPEKDLFEMRLVLDEALTNAVKHGHRGDATKWVRCRYQVDEERVLAEVEDEGPGFDPDQVSDPRLPANLDRPNGRGLLLMRAYTTWLRYNSNGNCVTLCKYRSSL